MDLLLYYGFIFVVYGYLGWGLENLFSYCVSGHRQEEGFLYSYFKTCGTLTINYTNLMIQY